MSERIQIATAETLSKGVRNWRGLASVAPVGSAAMQMAADQSVPVQRLSSLQRLADSMSPRGANAAAALSGLTPQMPRLEPASPAHSIAIGGALSGTIQRYFDYDSNSIPEDEKTPEGFLAGNYLDDEGLLTETDWETFVERHKALIALSETEAASHEEYGQKKLAKAYEDLASWVEKQYLQEGSAKWDMAIDEAADEVEKSTGIDVTKIAKTKWPGRSDDPPEAFTQAVHKRLSVRETERLKMIEQEFDSWDDGRLQIGVIIKVKKLLKNPDLEAVRAKLRQIYAYQIAPSHENWLKHLGIAGQEIVGSKTLHYTTYNNSVTEEGIDLANDSIDTLMSTLFGTVDTHLQIHASWKNGLPYYRKYYDGSYYCQNSANGTGVPCPAPQEPILRNLNETHAKMVKSMRDGVTSAKKGHGRIGANKDGAQTMKFLETLSEK